MSMQMPIFQGVMNPDPLEQPIANGPPDGLLGIRKKAVCVSKRMQSIYSKMGLSKVKPLPANPSSWWRGGGEGGQAAISI
jgi:hypothetical protein